MLNYLCLILIFQTLNCEEIATIKNETDSELKKDKSKDQNTSVEMQRITQPSAQTQHIERALSATNSSLDKAKSDFKPSPQLETYYEFNKFPVAPALPEAKRFAHFNFGELPTSWQEDNFPKTEQPWTARVKFPTPSVPTATERPYQFYNEDKGSTGKSYSVPTQSDTFFSQPLNKVPTVDDWNQFIGNYEPKKPIVQQNQFELIKPDVQKNKFDFSAPVPVEKPTYEMNGGGIQKNNFDFSAVEKPSPHEVQGIPWKKIIKFLTAFIPIGLLISALTPTVITVTSVNGTQSRSRAEDSGKHTQNKLISSLNYFNKLNAIGCEDRILCELLLSATSTQNAEQHIENILNTFTEDGKVVEKAEEMKKIFKAVRKQDCRPIVCTNIKENT